MLIDCDGKVTEVTNDTIYIFDDCGNRIDVREFTEITQKRSDSMAEFVFTREKSVKVGEEVGIQNAKQIPFDVIVDGDNKKVAFNQDGEYLVSVFDGNVTVTTLKRSQ